MKISELFYSIQGEGKLAGVPSAFVRAAGCNLRCAWCDTPYASWAPEGREMTAAEIGSAVAGMLGSHAVLTGGEPTIFPDVVEVCTALRAAGRHLTVETAGTVFVEAPMDLASLSPKLANSTPGERDSGRFAEAHERNRLNLPVLQKYIDFAPRFQLKFVVSNEADLPEIEAVLDGLCGWSAEDVLLMPEGTAAEKLWERSRWLVEACKKTGYRYCPRLHVELYGNRRGV